MPRRKTQIDIKKPARKKAMAEPTDDYRSYYNSEEQKDKTLLMWAGVIFFMVLIGFFWILNTKKMFQENSLNQPESTMNWGEIGDGLGETWKTLKDSLEEMKEVDGLAPEEGTNLDSATSTPSLPDAQISDEQLSKEEFEELKKQLKEIEERLETAPTSAE